MPTLLSAFGERKTVREWSLDPRCSVSLMTLLNRVRMGWAPETAIGEPSNRPADRLRRIVDAFGESKALADWAADPRCSCDATTLAARIKDGWQPERAISTATPSVPKRVVQAPIYDGKTITQWVRDPRCLVTRRELVRNLKANMPIEQAIVHHVPDTSPPEEVRPVLDQIGPVTEYLNAGAELWVYQRTDSIRISLLIEGRAYSVTPEILQELVGMRVIESRFRTSNATHFRLVKRPH